MFQNDLKSEITGAIQNRERLVVSVIVAKVIRKWAIHEQQDERYKMATVKTLESEAQKLINSVQRRDVKSSEQIQLPFEEKCLQSHYFVEGVGLPIEKMDQEQLAAKAEEHRMQGFGHFNHANEIDAYIAEKFGKIDNSLPFDEAIGN